MAGPPVNFRYFPVKICYSGSDRTQKGFHHLTPKYPPSVVTTATTTTTTTTQRARKESLQRETLAPSNPYGRYEDAGEASKTISTIGILSSVKAIFEKRAAAVEVDKFISLATVRNGEEKKQ